MASHIHRLLSLIVLHSLPNWIFNWPLSVSIIWIQILAVWGLRGFHRLNYRVDRSPKRWRIVVVGSTRLTRWRMWYTRLPLFRFFWSGTSMNHWSGLLKIWRKEQGRLLPLGGLATFSTFLGLPCFLFFQPGLVDLVPCFVPSPFCYLKIGLWGSFCWVSFGGHTPTAREEHVPPTLVILELGSGSSSAFDYCCLSLLLFLLGFSVFLFWFPLCL